MRASRLVDLLGERLPFLGFGQQQSERSLVGDEEVDDLGMTLGQFEADNGPAAVAEDQSLSRLPRG
ncbi:hypothetical protein IQ251_18460 [Saccharopolyspora sp. HNM0983]|uniref:Uncharacterized protein n=1 Tax=Saccharopolyspora montiporae TaxID=2781240 RepID=A0A929BAQ7_9PSEU|nr:hypothetical protein [Saccharopolyspora sp. HNM0983]MBE9376439.1 hypothetical protein [Saccharopolyspora sp. HNM0983]